MSVGIVMPVVIQNAVMLKVTTDAVAHLHCLNARLYVISNRLHSVLPEQLQYALGSVASLPVRVIHEPGVERSVAGAWNHGCELALTDGAETLAIVANDTRLAVDCLPKMVKMLENPDIDICSGISTTGRDHIDHRAITDGCDFSCFAMRADTYMKHGLFDTNFRPAYFEDNDYYGRIALAGGHCRVIHGAQFFHHGSMTIKSDPERQAAVQYWFEKNKEYFKRKWGCEPANDEAGVRAKYYGHPFNDRRKPLSWFPADSA